MSPHILKKKKNLLFLLMLTILLGIGIAYGISLYSNEYQEVLHESAKLEDSHCIAVNPRLIETKTAYIGSMKSILASDSASYISAQYSWLGSAREYLKLEKQWLMNEREFLNESRTKQFLSKERQEGAAWLYAMYQKEYEGIEGVVRSFDSQDVNLREIHERMVQIESDRNISEQTYKLTWGNQARSKSFMDQFIAQPVSQCPPKSQQIPQIEEGIQAKPVPDTQQPETLMPVIR